MVKVTLKGQGRDGCPLDRSFVADAGRQEWSKIAKRRIPMRGANWTMCEAMKNATGGLGGMLPGFKLRSDPSALLFGRLVPAAKFRRRRDVGRFFGRRRLLWAGRMRR
jgi:hypothetical protein